MNKQQTIIDNAIIVIARIANGLASVASPERITKAVSTLTNSLSNEQKILLEQVLKSLILQTNGSVETIRNPEDFSKANDPWYRLGKQRVIYLIHSVNPSFDSGDYPTKQDYENAHRLIPLMGKSSLSAAASTFADIDDIRKDNFSSADAAYQDDFDQSLEGFDTLYRGLGIGNVNVVEFLMSEDGWELGIGSQEKGFKGVSTSTKASVAYDFGEAKVWQYGIILAINNPQRKGFIAQDLSKYYNESEVILSGRLQIDSFKLAWRGTCYFDGYESNHRFIEAAWMVLDSSDNSMKLYSAGSKQFPEDFPDHDSKVFYSETLEFVGEVQEIFYKIERNNHYTQYVDGINHPEAKNEMYNCRFVNSSNQKAFMRVATTLL